jgi:hypothetical protein
MKSRLLTTTIASAVALLTQTHFASALDIRLMADAYTDGATANVGTAYPTQPLSVHSTGPRRSWIKFDLAGGLPPGTSHAQISKATLRLYATTVTTAGNVMVQAAGASWIEAVTASGGIKHNTAPALSNDPVTGNPYATVNINAAGLYFDFDVTELVKDWLDGTKVNHGLALVPSGTVNVVFDQKEGTTTSQQPQLHIALSGPVGPQGPVGATGPQGSQGVQGPQGIQGPVGPAATRILAQGNLSMGSFTSGPLP